MVTSTFGDGEFPDNATLFWEAISAETERLEHLSFAVLALGDTSYELFCNAGKLLDERLEELGATRLTDRVDVDGFYEQPAKAWTTDVVKLLTAEQDRAPRRRSSRALPRRRTAERRRAGSATFPSTPAWSSTDCSPHRSPTRRSATTSWTSPAPESPTRQAIRSRCTRPTIRFWSRRCWPQLGVGPDYAVADHDEPLGVLLTEQLEIRTPSRALQALAASPHQR